MNLIGFSYFPLQSAKEVAKRALEIPRLPDYIKGKGNYLYTTAESSVGLIIYEFDSAKADEALEQIRSSYWHFHDIPNHNYELRPCVKARDAAKAILELA